MSTRRLKKHLGQHFLTRSEVCAPLVEFLDPSGRLVVEIGPGAGALSQALLDAEARVLGWEIDLHWAVEVQSRFREADFTIVVGDAQELPWCRLRPVSLVAGNLPYNVATRIVLDMLESTLAAPGRIESAGFLVQREVALRLGAAPGESAYGALSVLVAAMANVEPLGSVAPGAFRPPPRVDSAFVGITPRRPLVTPEHYPRFKQLVRAAFAQRRKTLRNSLSATLGIEVAEALLDAVGMERTTRAESLRGEHFAALLDCLQTIEK